MRFSSFKGIWREIRAISKTPILIAEFPDSALESKKYVQEAFRRNWRFSTNPQWSDNFHKCGLVRHSVTSVGDYL